ncbi:ribonuclease H-like domain-containing protein [Pseudoxanthomonas dokdonensis]|uniref:Exonuclease n=1 Tax=Pseudoxanthomonas dokdonensis TaxID=344882 RepID=A0A0R0CLW2_9GAMM|nr:ribonuclease H-like domain-containing protein [Pseudoxanthomonas dokdonensis]KRG71005.1 exonuclease [Pseudoxanthomonas dokdonensis]
MSISLEKLKRLKQQAGVAATPTSAQDTRQQVARLRSLLRVRHAAQAPPRQADASQRGLPGEEIADGLRLLQTWLPWSPLPPQLDGGFAGDKALQGRAIDTGELMFFDTETTGLAGGTGTRAFMIGASDFHAGGLRVRQLLMTRMAAESDLLDTFASWLTTQTRLISYNGRCYDAPLLNTRYRLARKHSPLPALAHLDLLFPTRKRYRGVWENCRLATIERQALGILREDDLPGSEAPAAWLGYLRGGSSELLNRVIAHNLQDVVTLAHLLQHLARLGAPQPLACAGM